MKEKPPPLNLGPEPGETVPPGGEGEGKSFEVSLARLEKIVQQLEGGRASLEKSVELFEEGMKLAEICRRQLDQAENKIEILIRRADGRMHPQEFPVPAGDNQD